MEAWRMVHLTEERILKSFVHQLISSVVIALKP